jgi:hypothetical protein
MLYVTMTDRVLGGFSYSRGRTTKLVFWCRTMEEAQIVKANAENRSDISEIEIRELEPVYAEERFIVIPVKREMLPYWYEKGFFKDKVVIPNEAIQV